MKVNRVMASTLCIAAALCLESSGNSRTTDKNWDVYYGSAGNSHASDLAQINRSNVGKLKEVWRFDTGEAGGLETTPLILDGVVYALTPSQKVIALDGSNGKLLWTFDSKVKGTGPNRGLSFWHSGNERRIFVGIVNFLYALDPLTGRPISSFGQEGRVDLREGLGRDPAVQSIALTSPGVVYRDLIIVGGRVPETTPAPPGDIRAYDVRTGIVRWTFHTIPHPGEFGYETWPKDAWKSAGSANNWAGMAVDVEHGIVFVPTGSAVPDFYGGSRRGDDLFANCLLARPSFGPGRAQPATAAPIERDEFLALDAWGRHWTAGTWREYLAEGERESKLAVIRQRTHTGRPLGNTEFVQDLEKATQRQLTLQKRGPREKIVTDRRQSALTFDP